MHRFLLVFLVVWLVCASLALAHADGNLIANPNFDTVLPSGQPQGWSFWTRTQGAGSIEFDRPSPQSQIRSIKVNYHNSDDWSLASDAQTPVHPGEIYELSGWAKAEGAQDAVLSVVTRSADGQTIDWSYASV